MISCLLMLSLGILVSCSCFDLSGSLDGISPYLCRTARMSSRKIHVLDISWQNSITFANLYFHKSACARTRGHAQFQHFVTRSVLSGSFQFIWQRPLVPLALYKRGNKLHFTNWISFQISLSWFQSNRSIIKIHRFIDIVHDTHFTLC